MGQLAPLILESQGKGNLAGFLVDSIPQKVRIKIGDYIFNIWHEYSWAYAKRTEGAIPRVGGMIIKLAADEFIIAGTGVIVTFEPVKSDSSFAGIGIMDEGEFVRGVWTPGRRMNGDQSHQGRHMHLPGGTFSMQKVKLYTYK